MAIFAHDFKLFKAEKAKTDRMRSERFQGEGMGCEVASEIECKDVQSDAKKRPSSNIHQWNLS